MAHCKYGKKGLKILTGLENTQRLSDDLACDESPKPAPVSVHAYSTPSTSHAERSHHDYGSLSTTSFGLAALQNECLISPSVNSASCPFFPLRVHLTHTDPMGQTEKVIRDAEGALDTLWPSELNRQLQGIRIEDCAFFMGKVPKNMTDKELIDTFYGKMQDIEGWTKHAGQCQVCQRFLDGGSTDRDAAYQRRSGPDFRRTQREPCHIRDVRQVMISRK